ncbi:class I SAM-dependent methyltransferase [Acidobacteriia bacterium AH_259_A11_L15]|nr:class I SAM-dependent methyltransferase [Acidobacteriia bacterium AH_259_A11_L15]
MGQIFHPPKGVSRRLRRLLRLVWYRFFSHHPHHYLGALIWASMGSGARHRFTSRLLKTASLYEGVVSRCLCTYWTDCYYTQYIDSATTPEPNRQLWGGGSGTEWHLNTLAYYTQRKDEFEREYGPLLGWLSERLAAEEYDWVIELGCGNGMLIERIAERASHLSCRFVGLDINAKIIALNRQRYRESRVGYYEYRTLQDFLSPGRPSSLLLLANGTLQCFTEKELSLCLAWLTNHISRGALVVRDMTRPDLAHQERSQPAGGLAFFHNYAFLFSQAGLKNIQYDLEPQPGSRTKNILLSASWGSHPPLQDRKRIAERVQLLDTKNKR